MTNRTQLASGEILNGTILSVWLVQPADKPGSVVALRAYWGRKILGTRSAQPMIFGSGYGLCSHAWRGSKSRGPRQPSSRKSCADVYLVPLLFQHHCKTGRRIK
jgi:hypothetical protein